MKFLILILFLSSTIFSMPTKRNPGYPIRVKDIPIQYRSDYSTVHPVFSDSAKYIFFFTSRNDILDTMGYIPFMIENELRIIKVRDKSIISRIPIVPYRVSNRNNLYYLNKKLVDNDEFFEVTECFYQNNKGMWHRIIDHNGTVLHIDQGSPKIHTYKGKKAITILKNDKIVTYYLDKILPKRLSKRKYNSLSNLVKSLRFNILYKSRYEPVLTIKHDKNVNTYIYEYRDKEYSSTQHYKFSSFKQKK